MLPPVGWVDVHPEITPPSNFHQLRDTTKAELLPPVEIRAAAARVIAESGEMPRVALIIATARLLGFAKTGKDLRDRIDGALPIETA
ncbi:MAG: hypothetical protein FJY43_12125 [Betaproteobacteria bacterium]|nr:hypothetical protein [Betaproteobacteria bacterium]